MRTNLHLEQGSEEWTNLRKTRIGASDVSVIMGDSPFKTRYELWEEKAINRKVDQTLAMRRGIEGEGEVRNAACEYFNCSFEKACFENSKYPWMIASLDGWNEEVGAIEIKLPNADDHALAKAQILPAHYQWQCQAIMAITETKSMWYISQREDTVYVPVNRNDSLCEKLLVAGKEFLELVKRLDPPDLSEKDYIQFFDEENIEEEFRKAQKELKFWEAQYETLKEKAIAQVGARNAYLGNLKITKSVRPGTIDYKSIEALKGIDLELYRKSPITSYRLS